MEFLWEGLLSITWQQLVMYAVGGLLIWLAIEKDFEPQLGQQLVNMGQRVRPPDFRRWMNSLPSSIMVRSALKLVSKM